MEYCWIISGVLACAVVIMMILVIILFIGYKRLKYKNSYNQEESAKEYHPDQHFEEKIKGIQKSIS